MSRALLAGAFALARPLVAFVAFTLVSLAAGAVSYTYDELGRLKSVLDNAGNTAEYVYDALGNIKQIKQLPSGTLSITEFTPNSGPAGTSVTIFGGGFSATVASNTVKFNGVTATVTSAAVNKLVATVPATATTGKITVTVGVNTATSADDFTVTASNGAPTIASITPSCAVPGTVVTVSGSNFDLAPNATKVEVNTSIVAPSSVTTTQVQLTAPATVGTGKVKVTTPVGAATSANPLIIPPPDPFALTPIPCASLVSVQSLVAGGSAVAINIASAGKYGAILFDGNVNDYLTIQLSNYVHSASGSVTFTAYGPDNVSIASGTVSSASLSVHIPRIVKAGTHVVVFNPGAGATASFTAQLETGVAIGVDAATPLNASIGLANTSKRFTFDTAAGQNVGIGITDLVIAPTAITSASLYVAHPNGTQVNTNSCFTATTSGPGCGHNLNNLSVGTYALIVQPAGSGGTATFKLQVNTDVAGSLTGNAATPISLKPGQNARYTFSGTANQSVALEFAGVVTNPVGRSVRAYVYRPGDVITLSGSTFAGAWVSDTWSSNGYTMTLPVLPQTGTYTVVIDSSYQETVSLKLTVEAGFALAIDGPAADASIATTGESARFTFGGTQGQSMGLAMTDLVLSPTTATTALTRLYKPDGTAMLFGGNCAVSGSGCAWEIKNLPVTGTYSIVVSPDLGATGSLRMWLSTNVVNTIAIGSTATVNISRPGQNQLYTFSGTAGQLLRLTLSNATSVPAGQYITATVNKADGSFFTSTGITAGATTPVVLDIPALPATESYTIWVEVLSSGKAGATATLTMTLATR